MQAFVDASPDPPQQDATFIMNLLVAVDGSPPSLDAVTYAIELSRKLAVPPNSIALISVHDDVGLRRAEAFVGHEAIAQYLRERSENDLEPAIELLEAAGIRADVLIRTGHVAHEIVEVAKVRHFDLIILGAKGRGAIRDLFIGSVAQRVLATATCPVLLVR
jgi:nucleotide-binding universal stress UspA family protein